MDSYEIETKHFRWESLLVSFVNKAQLGVVIWTYKKIQPFL